MEAKNSIKNNGKKLTRPKKNHQPYYLQPYQAKNSTKEFMFINNIQIYPSPQIAQEVGFSSLSGSDP